MPKRRITPDYIACHIRRVLENGGSAPHAKEVQSFFKEGVKSRGWYTAELRKVAVRFRRTLMRERGADFLLNVADKLFSGSVLEEKVFAVLLLEKLVEHFGEREFKLFETWIPRVGSWADHDALIHDLIAPMIADKPSRSKVVFRWAKSGNRWYRRAACVALIRGSRQNLFLPDVKRLAALLLSDEDDMVQKGLGWLLRETAKADPKRTVPYLMSIPKAPRLVLRTACETLPAEVRARILGAASCSSAAG